jgi:hypothetical protein
VNWVASAPSGSGLVVEPASGTISVPAEASVAQPVSVVVPAGTAAGAYLVTFALQAAAGVVLPAVVAEVDVS